MLKPEEKIAVIIGLAASGKTTLSEYLHERFPDHSLFHTDDYMSFGYEESLYRLMSDLQADQNPLKIIEGVQGYRLLRKLLQIDQAWNVDLIIVTVCDEEERMRRYLSRPENAGKADKLLAFDKNLEKVEREFHGLLTHHQKNVPDFKMPRIVWHHTSTL